MTSQEQEWLTSLLLVEDGLSDWELNFVTDMDRKSPAELSKLQHDKLKSLSFDKGM